MQEIKHIIITDPHMCCGCTACASACPKTCISMKEDREGFLYPEVDTVNCIECGICSKACPVLHPYTSRRPLAVYAMKHPDSSVREASASGGAFPMLAKAVIDNGGLVFGSRFDSDLEAVHDCCDTIEGLSPFTGSKYIQSRMEDNYPKIRAALRSGRRVLFTGTGCQVAGLKHYLDNSGKTRMDTLLAVDLICHGAPSPKVWRQYLREEKEMLENRGYKNVKIESVRFRDKKNAGWKGYNFKIFFTATDNTGRPVAPILCEKGKAENLFIRGFLADMYSRPSCHRCPAREFRGGSDLTIGDFWGIGDLKPGYDDDRGVSAILANTRKGIDVLHEAGCSLGNDILPMDYHDVLRRNHCLETSVPELPEKRGEFFRNYPVGGVHATIQALI